MSARLLHPAEAAERLGVRTWTLRRWTVAGRLPSQVTPGGHHRYREADIDALVQVSKTTAAVKR